MDPQETEYKRDKEGKFVAGTAAGPGRPPGISLKEFVRNKFYSMSDEEKAIWLRELPKEVIWKMGEGNPDSKSDITSAGRFLMPELSDDQYTRLIREGATRLDSEESSEEPLH